MLENQIAKIKDKALENHVPIVRDKTIEKITQILKEKHVKSILEIGTAVGYSGIIMLSTCKANLTTIEKNCDRIKEAKANFEIFGFENRVKLLEGDALERLEELVDKNEKFDFIFLDGPKGQYVRYFPLLKKLLLRGGTLFADNILMGGLLENEERVNHKNRAMVKNMKAFLEKLQEDRDFSTTIYKIEDGYSISELL